MMSNVIEIDFHSVYQDLLDILVKRGIIKYDGEIGSYKWTANDNVIDDATDLPYDFGTWVKPQLDEWLKEKENEFATIQNGVQAHKKHKAYKFWKPGSRKE